MGIIQKVPVSIIQETTTTTTGTQVQGDAGTSQSLALPLAIGGVGGFAVLVLLSIVIYKRKGGTGSLKASLKSNRWLECEEVGNPVITRVPSNTLLESVASTIERKTRHK